MAKKQTPPGLTAAQKRAYAKALNDVEKKAKLARGDADAIQAKARRDVMASIDRAAAHTLSTAATTKMAKKGYRKA